MESNNVQPGQTVAPTPPSASGSPAPDVPVPPPAPAPPMPEPQIPAPEPTPEPSSAKPQLDDGDNDQKFDASLPEAETAPGTQNAQAITWTASEFIAHAKSPGWYMALFLAAAAAAVLIFLVTRDVVSSGVIIVAALVLSIYAGHKPRELEYRLDTGGLSIGQKHFGYHEFRSFSVLPEGAFSSIVFMPLKRFAAPTTIYYAPEDEDKIVSLIGNYLPLEEHGHDAVDRLMHRIHF